MDTSPEYIKMCEKAEDIQALRPYWMEEGDYFAICGEKRFDHVDICTYNNEGFSGGIHTSETDGGSVKRANIVWLPQQDQLQNIFFELHT